MRYVSTLIVVSDIKKSKEFYHDVLGLDVIADFGANVTLTGNISLQTLETWKNFINKDTSDIIIKNNACELYFEEDDMDKFIKKLDTLENIEYVHRLFEHRWGQRVVRFYDLDKHIIEVGENMVNVVKRFFKQGLSEDEIATRMDVPIDYIKSCLE
ncbi:VOC family protein [Inconstantimicrobium porci]|uniref:Glyoxalase n=1 Tax=Inconstantimicrobium porci TaxID=2652291 RepID=A0A7X2T1A7_9CLOT|nr:VOC family protein [Inconstantimicrobium porci]MDD6770594.1 VOC family protein [Inconstantimicrobium porci]MSR91427.1 glyoxalase [Inconstantimicrobium porci]